MTEFRRAPINPNLPMMGFDFDDTMFDTRILLQAAFKEWGLEYKKEDFFDPDPPKDFELTRRAFMRNTDFIEFLFPKTGIFQSLTLVAGRYVNPIVISNRWDNQGEAIWGLLENYDMARFFCGMFLRENQSSTPMGVQNRLEVKSENISRAGAEYMLEDEGPIALGLARQDPSLSVVMPDHTGNQYEPGSNDKLANRPNLIRCQSPLDFALGVHKAGSIERFFINYGDELTRDPSTLYRVYRAPATVSRSLLVAATGQSVFSPYPPEYLTA